MTHTYSRGVGTSSPCRDRRGDPWILGSSWKVAEKDERRSAIRPFVYERERWRGEKRQKQGARGHLQVFRGCPEDPEYSLPFESSAPFGPGASRATVDSSPSLLATAAAATADRLSLSRRWPDLLYKSHSIPSTRSSIVYPPVTFRLVRPLLLPPLCVVGEGGKADYSRRVKGRLLYGPGRSIGGLPGLQNRVAKAAKNTTFSDVHDPPPDLLGRRHRDNDEYNDDDRRGRLPTAAKL